MFFFIADITNTIYWQNNSVFTIFNAGLATGYGTISNSITAF